MSIEETQYKTWYLGDPVNTNPYLLEKLYGIVSHHDMLLVLSFTIKKSLKKSLRAKRGNPDDKFKAQNWDCHGLSPSQRQIILLPNKVNQSFLN